MKFKWHNRKLIGSQQQAVEALADFFVQHPVIFDKGSAANSPRRRALIAEARTIAETWGVPFSIPLMREIRQAQRIVGNDEWDDPGRWLSSGGMEC
jgi:hypothetical protein